MSVISDLVSDAKRTGKDAAVQNVLIGLHWTAVTSLETGLAATHEDAACCYANDISGTGQLHKRTALELVGMVESSHPLEVSVGLAALNSLMVVKPEDLVELNARDLLLERGRGKKAAVIGHFPFADALRKVVETLWVFELNPGANELPAEAAHDLLPQADIIGLTATTLMNGTFDSLNKLFSPRALVVMIGPSTPMNRILFDYGVDILAGSLVTDAKALFPYIGQGTTLHKVEGLRRVTMAKSKQLSGEG